MRIHGKERMQFGPEYLIPSPFDSRVLLWESPGGGRGGDGERGRPDRDFPRRLRRPARGPPRSRTRGDAAGDRQGEAVASFGCLSRGRGTEDPARCPAPPRRRDCGADPAGPPRGDPGAVRVARDRDWRRRIVDMADGERSEDYARRLAALRERRGVGLPKARELMKNPSVYGAMMVNLGHADTMVAGLTQHYPETIRPALQIVRMREEVRRVAGVYLMVFRNEIKFFADATVNIDPSAEDLADIAIQTAEVARRFHVEPRVAMLSFSNFGSAPHERSNKVRAAVEILRERAPELVADGEMQGGHRRGRRSASGDLPVLAARPRRECADLPEPRSRECSLQAAAASRRRRSDRSHRHRSPAGVPSMCCSAAPRWRRS